MPESKVTDGLAANLSNIENMLLFVDSLPHVSEFIYSKASQADIAALQNTLKYSQQILKQLLQRSAAYIYSVEAK